jgi:putative ABC transport system permease protein
MFVMNKLSSILHKLRTLGQRRAVKQEIDEELRFHLEQLTAEKIAAGMSAEDAAREARKRFGNLQSVREECREKRGASFGEATMRDLRFAFRQLLKNPGFTAVAVLTLALGIGVNTSMFSALQALTSRPLPYPDPGSLVQVFQSSPGSPWQSHHSAPNFLDYQQSGDFQFVAALNDKPFNLSEPGQPAERVSGLQVSADLFPLLGVQPALGRWFTADEDQPGRNDVVVLDYGFWQRRFAGDTNIIGRVIRLDGEPVSVVGVMPARFHDIMLMGPAYLWRPIAFTDSQRSQRGNQFLKCIARLKSGQSLRQAQAGTDLLAARQLQAHPENSAEGLRLVPLAESSLPPQARKIVWSVLALAGLVLLIACANLANLQLARTAMRGREFAIRGALGASRRRLLRQLLAESLLLAMIGGLVGLIFAHWSNALLSSQFVTNGEVVLQLPLNLKALAFAFIAATASGMAFGLVPAWLASRPDVNEALKQSSRGMTGNRSQHRMQHALVVAEVALAMMLLAGAGLVVNGLRGFAALDPGWRVEGMTLGYLTLPEAKYGNGNSLRAFADQLEQRLEAIPGVGRAAICWNLPVRQFNVTSGFTIDGRPEPPKGTKQSCSVNGVTPGYFDVLGMPILAGRDFSASDNTNRPPVVIINQTLARAFWPEGSPIGQRINGAEIVGVVGDVRFPANPTELRTSYQTYRPFAQEPRGFLNLALRGNVPAATLRRVVTEVDPDQPVGEPGPARADVERSLDNWGVGGNMLGLFALLGLALAALGIYGVISGFVTRRTGEIGVRMALGAQLRDVLWLVVGKGLRLALVGTALGLIGAFGITRLLRAVLPELPASDPLVIALVAFLLIAVTLVACWLPARRAARVQPMEALRNE